MRILVSNSGIYKDPSHMSEMVTECLFGEAVTIIKKEKYWFFVETKLDKYHGWIYNSNLGKIGKPTHKISICKSFLLKKPDIKSKFLMNLSLGSLLHVNKKIHNDSDFLCIKINQNGESAYVPKNHVNKIDDIRSDWVKVALEMLYTPYKWGGRSSYGLDCSALLQLCLNQAGIFIPRDTKDQVSYNKKIFREIKTLQKGSIVFWKGHVGIGLNHKEIIHANAYTKNVNIENFQIVKKRLNQNIEKIVKII